VAGLPELALTAQAIPAESAVRCHLPGNGWPALPASVDPTALFDGAPAPLAIHHLGVIHYLNPAARRTLRISLAAKPSNSHSARLTRRTMPWESIS
jgi:hypothetical protein